MAELKEDYSAGLSVVWKAATSVLLMAEHSVEKSAGPMAERRAVPWESLRVAQTVEQKESYWADWLAAQMAGRWVPSSVVLTAENLVAQMETQMVE